MACLSHHPSCLNHWVHAAATALWGHSVLLTLQLPGLQFLKFRNQGGGFPDFNLNFRNQGGESVDLISNAPSLTVPARLLHYRASSPPRPTPACAGGQGSGTRGA